MTQPDSEPEQPPVSHPDDHTLDGLARWTVEVLSRHHAAWPAEIRCLDLLEECGELARAVLVTERHKRAGKEDPTEDMETAICGVLVDIFSLADHYRITLATVYPRLICEFDRATARGLRDASFESERKWP